MTVISDLPWDLVEEILFRVPITSQVAVRSTCRRWKVLSKDERFTKKQCGKAAAKETMMIMVCDLRVCLMSVNLQVVHDHKNGLVEKSIKQIGKLSQAEVYRVHHCDGLLLCCLTKVSTAQHVLVVCNPYLGQVRWIQPRKKFDMFDRYDIGYDNNNNHKILRCLDHSINRRTAEYEIYYLKSNSWRVLDVIPDCYRSTCHQGCSLKGNTFFVARREVENIGEFLICFDFTRERFGPHLHLPFHSCPGDSVILSAVREEQIAVLFKRFDANEMDIWITTKIEANAVLWRKFVKLVLPFNAIRKQLYGSFFVDEKKKLTVICDTDREKIRNKAYVIGDDGYYEEVDLGGSTSWPVMRYYVPSLVQIQQGRPVPAGGKRKERDN